MKVRPIEVFAPYTANYSHLPILHGVFTMPASAQPSFQVRNIILPVIVLAVPVLGYFGWQYYQAKQNEQPIDQTTLTGYLKRITVADKLSDKFVDSNGDMVADGPKNQADRIDPDELVFCPGIISEKETEADWQEFTDRLAKVTGKKVRFESVATPSDVLEQLINGKIHVTSFSTGSVPTAVNKAGFVPVVALATADGSSNYVMEIIVPAASTIKGPADLKGKTLAMTTAGSHSGYKAPLIILEDEFHLRPGKDYQFVVSGSHGASIKMIAEGRADAAAVAADVLADAVAEGKPLKADQYRSVYKSKSFPKGAWGYTCLLKPELAAKVREAYVTFPFEGTKIAEKFKGSKAVKFAPVDYKKDWAYVREIDAKILAWK
jgi:phosphonate transport system substrate-binding protein